MHALRARDDVDHGRRPSDWIMYTDGGFSPARDMIAARAGYGWAIVSGGDASSDSSAQEITHGCGPVELDEHARGFYGACILSNNTAEGQALAELLAFLLRSNPPLGTCLHIRTDNQLVAG